jgi:hypothetical protein
MKRRYLWAGWTALVLTSVVVLATGACGGGDDGASSTATTAPVATETPGAPGAEERVTLTGLLTMDGVPLEAEFLGVRVMRDGLAAACQLTIPDVAFGNYEIAVASDTEVRGCGAPGAEILLWAYADDAYAFSSETLPWPGSGTGAATFDATFSSTAREGASKPVTEFKGHLFDRQGGELPAGTVVEAYVGDVVCGVTSLRYGEDVERFYTLIVAGPEAVPGCTQGATLAFRLDGEPAAETALNDLGSGTQGHELNLTLQ